MPQVHEIQTINFVSSHFSLVSSVKLELSSYDILVFALVSHMMDELKCVV